MAGWPGPACRTMPNIRDQRFMPMRRRVLGRDLAKRRRDRGLARVWGGWRHRRSKRPRVRGLRQTPHCPRRCAPRAGAQAAVPEQPRDEGMKGSVWICFSEVRQRLDPPRPLLAQVGCDPAPDLAGDDDGIASGVDAGQYPDRRAEELLHSRRALTATLALLTLPPRRREHQPPRVIPREARQLSKRTTS